MATAIIFPVLEYLKRYGGAFPGIDTLVYAIVTLVILLTLKDGIIPWVEKRRTRARLAKAIPVSAAAKDVPHSAVSDQVRDSDLVKALPDS